MTKIKQANRVNAYCLKHERTTEHMEYIKDDGTYVYKCMECYHELPYAYPVYGRQQPKLDIPKREEPKYGRCVA